MDSTGDPGDRESVLAWLESERRLGVRHAAVSPPSTAADVSRDAVGAAARPGSPASRPAPPARPPTPVAAAPSPGPRARPAAAATQFGLIDGAADLPPPCAVDLPLAEAAAALAAFDEKYVRGCRKCRLHEGRTQTVFGVGLARPDLVFVGEGPGADEDEQGLPFVGRAGQLLTRMIAAMTLTRDQVYICNVVKCRPPGNRTPLDDEMETCSPYLFRQLAILRPRVIVALGRPATQTLLATKEPISRLRGHFHDFPPPALAHLGLPSARLMPTFHPAYLLRNPPAKADAWADLKAVMAVLGLKLPPAASG